MMQLLAVNIRDKYFTNNPAANRFSQSPTTVFMTIIPNLIVIAGIIFLFFILFAGFKIIVGAGSGQSAQDAAKARSALTWSVVGFLIVILSYSILTLIGAFLGFNLTSDWLSGL